MVEVAIDRPPAQAVKTSDASGPRGFDVAKQTIGRKHHVLVDTLGLIWLIHVTAASVQDRDGALGLFAQLCQRGLGRVRLIWADSAYDAQKLWDWIGTHPPGPTDRHEHLQKLESLRDAVSFVHGINAWPYRLRYWRGDEKIFDKIDAADPAPRAAHTPFSGLRREVDIGALLSEIAEFLEPVTPFNEELTGMMYLFRQAGAKGVQRKIGALPLCALLESLTRLSGSGY